MFRRPGTGRSKATADTLCQKCLKRGHYSYECKAAAQERPYTSRPSRTQQLLNPKLKQKLTTEVPEDLLRKKGVADEILKAKEKERGRKSSRSRKRSRSLSRSSVDSASTISTNRSPSRSRSPPRRRKHGGSLANADRKALIKRQRRPVSRDSRMLDGSARNTRRRLSSLSPDERGRRRTRSQSTRMDTRGSPVRSKRDLDSLSRSSSRSRSQQRHKKRPSRKYSSSRSRSRSLNRMDTSDDRGRPIDSPRSTKMQSRSPSSYQGHNRSPSSSSRRKAVRRSQSPMRSRENGGWHGTNGYQGHDQPREPPRNRFDETLHAAAPRAPRAPLPAPVQRERSLSPYSKRVALTRGRQ